MLSQCALTHMLCYLKEHNAPRVYRFVLRDLHMLLLTLHDGAGVFVIHKNLKTEDFLWKLQSPTPSCPKPVFKKSLIREWWRWKQLMCIWFILQLSPPSCTHLSKIYEIFFLENQILFGLLIITHQMTAHNKYPPVTYSQVDTTLHLNHSYPIYLHNPNCQLNRNIENGSLHCTLDDCSGKKYTFNTSKCRRQKPHALNAAVLVSQRV